MACLFLSGCMNRTLEEQLLVIILGVDQTAENNIRITVKVPSNSDSGSSPSSGGEGDAASGGEQMGYLLMEATGKEFSDAMNLLNATTPRTLNFSQLREVVIGERAARSPRFSSLLHEISALPRMRSQAALVICKDDANSFATEQKPYVGMRLSRYVETTISNYAGKGFVPTTNLWEGLRDLGYGFRDPLLIYAAVNDFESTQAPDEENVLDAQAGGLPRKSVSPIEFFGAAATDGISVSGILTGYEMALLHLIHGDVQSLHIQEAGSFPVPIYARAPAALSVDLASRPIILRVSLACEAYPAPGDTPESAHLEKTLTEDVERVLWKLQSFRCDGVGFGNLAVRSFPDLTAWEAFGWREKYVAAQTEVKISVHMRED